jgi:signal transduction histidine kinase
MPLGLIRPRNRRAAAAKLSDRQSSIACHPLAPVHTGTYVGAVKTRWRRRLESCVIAVAAVAAATVLNAALWPWVQPQPFILLLGTVVVAACFGGVDGGVTASALSLLAGLIYFLPTYQAHPDHHLWPSDMFTAVFFLVISALIVVLVHRLHAARERAELDSLERQRVDDVRTRFVDILAHDLRNPLAVIRLSAQLQLQHEDLPRGVLDSFARTARSADRMLHLVDQLLDLARSRTSSGFPIERRPVSLAQVCREAMSDLGHTGDDPVELELVRDTVGEWDPDRLAQLVHNLICNAMYYRTPDTRIHLRVDKQDGWAVLTVEHQGAKIARDALDRLFEPFHRAPGGQKSGVGLGLYISQALAHAHGGTITPYSDEQMTRFTLRLPESAPEAVPAPIDRGQPGGASKPHLALSG